MTVKQEINHGSIPKVCHLHSDISHYLHLCHNLCQFYFITSHVLFAKNKGKDEFLYIATSAYHVISKEEESRTFRHKRIFRQTRMDKHSILANQWNSNIFV